MGNGGEWTDLGVAIGGAALTVKPLISHRTYIFIILFCSQDFL